MNRDIKKIAIVRLSALGDIVNSAFVLQFIKESYPNATISWFVEEGFAPLLEVTEVSVQVEPLSLKRIKKEKSIALAIKEYRRLQHKGPFDIVIDMQGLIKSALVTTALSKQRHGFDKESIREALASLFYTTTSHIPYEENVIQRNAKVVSDALNLTIDAEKIQQKDAVFRVTEQFLLPKRPKIALVIGASWASKRYPKEQFAEVCAGMDASFYIIWGSEDEKRDALWIAQHAPNASLAPKLSLAGLISFLSHMDLVIGNDTGPTHMAWAQNIASITLFGPTNERMIAQTPRNVALHSSSKVNLLKIDKNDFSIAEIQPQTIINQAQGLLH